MNYICQEGSVILPSAQYEDNSINILKFPESKASLTLTRDRLAGGQTTEQYLAAQIAVLRKGMKIYTITQSVVFKTHSGTDGTEFYCEIEQSGHRLWQYIAAYHLGEHIFVITYCLTRSFTDEDLLDWQNLKLGFTPAA
ncbi:DUF1795 domain-containing protein [Morganella morganii]|uniref:DcrB-related protein n=1 Tax=Morganella morganii TaxID=582 RepID=UPI0015F641EC|nr:DcrB-related protein [Morganella morganii]MBA5806703.1 DUF1795 domain-containing protein [Morganella morganii]